MEVKFVLTESGEYTALFEGLENETMHSKIGPTIETNTIYIEGARIASRLQKKDSGTLVVWDVGLGLATNAIETFKMAHGHPRHLEIVSFESRQEALREALTQPEKFPWMKGYLEIIQNLLSEKEVTWGNCTWKLFDEDFRTTLENRDLPPPEVVYYDFFSPKVCPELWTPNLFQKIKEFALKGPNAADFILCTYSCARLVRDSLSSVGFALENGATTAQKKKTTRAVF